MLADEINRSPAKVQSALLEAMQERQVSIGGETLPLPQPFMVLATQNPIEQEGTYPLPEAQLDRFMLKAVIAYPSRLEERAILDRAHRRHEPVDVRRIVAAKRILSARALLHEVYIDERLKDYIIQIVSATRQPRSFRMEAHGAVHRLRRLTARHDLPRPGRAGERLPGRAQLRDAGRYQVHSGLTCCGIGS